jgi:hypothetical protein
MEYSKKNTLFKIFSQIVYFYEFCCYDATMTKQDQIKSDKDLILVLGGTSYLSKKLQISKQRVHNWMTRGIPASIKLANPKLFLNKRIKK